MEEHQQYSDFLWKWTYVEEMLEAIDKTLLRYYEPQVVALKKKTHIPSH